MSLHYTGCQVYLPCNLQDPLSTLCAACQKHVLRKERADLAVQGKLVGIVAPKEENT